MKGITVCLIVDDLLNDMIEGRQYPAILMSIMCDALAIRGAVMSYRSLSTMFRFSGPNEVHECRDVDVVCLTIHILLRLNEEEEESYNILPSSRPLLQANYGELQMTKRLKCHSWKGFERYLCSIINK